MNSKNCFWVAGLAIVIIAALVIVFSSCINKVTTGKLEVTSQIDQVNVIINEKQYVTPFEVTKIKSGDYSMSAYKEGFLVKKIPFTITAGQTTQIEIELEEDPANKEIPEGAPID